MAELLGIITSTITVVETAGKIGSSILKLKRLWDEVKDVPQSIQALMEELEQVNPLLDAMEAEFTEIRCIVRNDKVAKASMEYCCQARDRLDGLVRELQQEIESKRRLKRGVAKVKVALKSGLISKHQEKMRSALQLLNFAQQIYMMALTRLQPSLVAAEFRALIRKANEVRPEATNDQIRSGAISVLKTRKPSTVSWLASSSHRHSWSRALLGEVVWDTLEEASDTWPQIKTQVYRARVELPAWLTQTVWNLNLASASGQWTTCLRSYTVRPSFLFPIFYYALHGNSEKVLEELHAGRASLHDRTPSGRTLLHMAAWGDNATLMRLLVQLGLDLYETDRSGRTPLAYAAAPRYNEQDLMIDTEGAQFIISQYDMSDVEELTRKAISQPCDGTIEPRVSLAPIWISPSLFHNFRATYFQVSVTARYLSIDWSFVNPALLLHILSNDNNIDPALFRAQLERSQHGSLRELIRRLAELHLTRPKHQQYYITQWRSLTQWVLTGIEVEELVTMSTGVWTLHIRDEPATVFGSMFKAWETWIAEAKSTPHTARAYQRELRELLVMLLEDLKSAGVELREYGRQELPLFTKRYERDYRVGSLATSSDRQNDLETIHSGPYLVTFTYGQEPEDWGLKWDLWAEEFAGEFFEMIEAQRYRVPGAWVDG